MIAKIFAVVSAVIYLVHFSGAVDPPAAGPTVSPTNFEVRWIDPEHWAFTGNASLTPQ